MDPQHQDIDLSQYNTVLTVFIELRGRGVAVSAQDLEVLKGWANERFDPEFLCQSIVAIYRDCEEKGTHFPNSLKALDRPLRRAIREANEY
ncbi:MAG: hypothetical protein RI932_617 [Pseudomonadota bacterium]|jgi:hypothetical protein